MSLFIKYRCISPLQCIVLCVCTCVALVVVVSVVVHAVLLDRVTDVLLRRAAAAVCGVPLCVHVDETSPHHTIAQPRHPSSDQ